MLEYSHDGGWQTTYMEIKIGDLIGFYYEPDGWKYLTVIKKMQWSDSFIVEWMHGNGIATYPEDILMDWKQTFYEYLNQNP